MACKYVCDACGKECYANHNGRSWFKPYTWFQRSDDDGPQDACSRECIQIIASKSGKTSVVVPI